VTASLEMNVRDSGAQAALRRLQALGRSPRALFGAIAAYGESSTRARFKNQVGPDGKKWTPSKRVKQGKGTMTLVHTARLLRSIAHRHDSNSAEWGTNVVYAGIHNFGGEIKRAAFSSWLRLRTNASGRLLRQRDHERLAVFAKATHKRAVTRRYTVDAHTIKMPARPFLGINEADQREIGALSGLVVDEAAKGRGGL